MSMPERGSTEECQWLRQSPEDAADEQDAINASLDEGAVRQMRFDIIERSASPSRRLPQAVLDLIESGDRGIHTMLFDLFYWAIVEENYGGQWEAWRQAINILKEAAANEREMHQ